MEHRIVQMIRWIILLFVPLTYGQNSICPTSEAILPCICTNRHEDIQIWCTHSDLTQVLKGIQKVGNLITKPIDELIIENNYLPSLPGKIFQNVKILRLMLRHNGLERVSAAWLETQEMNLVEIFIVENELRNIPAESLMKLQNLQAITIHSHNLKRIPMFSNVPKLKYISIQSKSLNAINEYTFENLPNLEKLFIGGSPHLGILKENALYNLHKLKKIEITNCGINLIHIRALSLIPSLNELSFSDNKISDATMVGRATRDLPLLSHLNLNNNFIDKLNEGAFVDQPMLETLFLANNNISAIHHGAFHRVPKLRVVDLNYNKIRQIHPESFLQQSGSGVEELTLIGNEIMHISEFRALLDALPRLRFLDMSDNMLQEIPRGALRGHPSLERLHLNKNSIKFIQAETFVAMPALRELHLSNNSLSDVTEGPFWDLPALKGLDLSNNKFQRLQPKLLYNLPALRRINFSNNRIGIIDPITFIEAPLLEYVNISRNALVSIHPATFRNLGNLYEIDASSNRLIEFVPGLPRGLEQLYLQMNQITSLPGPPSPDLDLPSLRTLDISSNGIQKIPYGSMKTLHNLRRLYMKRNGLRQIDTTAFSDLDELEILDLSENQIISVHHKSFSKLHNLKQLYLDGNTIDNFDFMTIKDNVALSMLDFSKNKMKSIGPSTFNKVMEVEILNISSNNLNEFPSALGMFTKLKVLDASFNHIKHFNGNSLNNLHSLNNIKLPHNKITEIRSGSFKDLNSLEMIDLDNNHIEIIHSEAMANLPNLMSIYLAQNHIIDLPDHVFLNLPKLRIIDLQGNRLQFISIRAFENMPLVQYMNLSNNQITNIDNSGIRKLITLEVLDLSFNKLTRITKESFQFMEWLVELNLDNNWICQISSKPFDFMPRLKVLSLRHNKLSTISEATFEKLRNNIAILDIDGNPFICDCGIIWLKSWLLESTSVGPKCTDGTYVKGMPFTQSDCPHNMINNEDVRLCVLHENEALLPNLATSQVFASLDKLKDYTTQIKNNFHTNKINNRPLPEETDYFYDDYVDYPYNETLIDGINDDANSPKTNKTDHSIGQTPTIYAEITNTTKTTPVKNSAVSVKAPNSGFTFFGMPLPPIDMGKLLNTGRKIDWPENRTPPPTKTINPQQNNKYKILDPPKFETGGFTPMLPSTASGFVPMSDPAINVSHTLIREQNDANYKNKINIVDSTVATTRKPVSKTIQNSTTHQKTKSEIHEIQAYLDDDTTSRKAYNRTKNEEENSAPNNLRKYNLIETNLTVTEITEKEGLLITTDTSNEMGLQVWTESGSVAHSTKTTSKPPKKNHIEPKPTALSAVYIPSNIEERNYSTRPATITKVNIPLVEQYNSRENFSPVTNREAKMRFSEIMTSGSTRTRQVNGKEWYYKNYNNSNLKPYIAPGIHSISSIFNYNIYLIVISTYYSLLNI